MYAPNWTHLLGPNINRASPAIEKKLFAFQTKNDKVTFLFLTEIWKWSRSTVWTGKFWEGTLCYIKYSVWENPYFEHVWYVFADNPSEYVRECHEKQLGRRLKKFSYVNRLFSRSWSVILVFNLMSTRKILEAKTLWLPSREPYSQLLLGVCDEILFH